MAKLRKAKVKKFGVRSCKPQPNPDLISGATLTAGSNEESRVQGRGFSCR